MSNQRVAGREHIPIYPKGFIALRIVQLVLALIILALAAYGVALVAFDGDIFIMVVALMTMIVTIYYIVCEFGAPAIYNYWAVLALDIFLLVMWIASFGLLASEVAAIFAVTTYYDYWSGSYYSSNGLSKTGRTWASCLAGAAGLGGLEFALFIASLAIHGVMMHRHRSAGLHCTPVDPNAPAPPVGGGATDAKHEMQFQTPAVYPHQQQYAVPQHTQSPPPQQVYAAPVAAYPNQQVSPLVQQNTGGYTQQQQPVQYQQGYQQA